MVKTGWRWLLWWVFLGAWTVALLTPHPVYIQQAIFPEGARFSAAKTLHVGAYAFLTACTAWLAAAGWMRWLLVALLSLHAFATEYVQNFVELRHGSWTDVGIDHAGILLGLVMSWPWWRRSVLRGREAGLKVGAKRPLGPAPAQPAE